VLRIVAKVPVNQGWRESIKAGDDSGMGGEKIAHSGNGQCDVEGLRTFLHEAACPFQYGERRVPFIEMTDFRLYTQRTEQPPSADSKQQLLCEAQLGTAAVQLTGNTSMDGVVRRVIAVQQIQFSNDRPEPARRAARSNNRATRFPTATTHRSYAAPA